MFASFNRFAFNRSISLVTSLSTRMMSTYNIGTVGVIGMGSMGHGIAQNAASKGFNVVAVDSNQTALEGGIAHIKNSLGKVNSKLVSKGKMTEDEANTDLENTMGRITGSTELTALADCDLVIEAIIENMDIKKKIYGDLSKIVKPEGIFASNTSSLSITDIGIAGGRPEKTVGLHFFNPVQLMKLVEVVKTDKTEPAVFDAAKDFVKKLGKAGVSCKDTPGFVVNRLLVPYIAQALKLKEDTDTATEDIDTAMVLGAGHPMGPLKLADYVGLDVCLFILETFKKELPDEQIAIPEILKKKVSAGQLGKKTGSGFYNWDGMKTTGVNE